jgi:hypothetical protein
MTWIQQTLASQAMFEKHGRKSVCFRQSCVTEESGLFLLGWSGEDAAHGGAADIETAGDLGFAEAGAA